MAQGGHRGVRVPADVPLGLPVTCGLVSLVTCQLSLFHVPGEVIVQMRIYSCSLSWGAGEPSRPAHAQSLQIGSRDSTPTVCTGQFSGYSRASCLERVELHCKAPSPLPAAHPPCLAPFSGLFLPGPTPWALLWTLNCLCKWVGLAGFAGLGPG